MQAPVSVYSSVPHILVQIFSEEAINIFAATGAFGEHDGDRQTVDPIPAKY